MAIIQPTLPEIPTIAGADTIDAMIRTAAIWASTVATQLSGALGALSKDRITITSPLPYGGNISGISIGSPPGQPDSPGIVDIVLPPSPADPTGFVAVEYEGDPFPFPEDIVSRNIPEEVIRESAIEDYISTLLDTVKDQLSNRLTYGGTGLPIGIETALFDREKERSDRTWLASRTRLENEWVKRGFDIPREFLTASLDNLDTGYLHKRLQVERDISIKKEELTQTNLNQTLELSAQLESQLMAYHNQFQELLQNTVATLQRTRIDIYRSWENLYKYYQESVKSYYEDIASEARIGIEINRDIISRYASEVKFFSLLARNEIDKAIILLKIFENDILAYQAKMAGYLSAGKTAIKRLESQIDYVIGTSNVSVMAAEATMQANIDRARYMTRAAISAGTSASIMAAGAVSGKHISMSLSEGKSGSSHSIKEIGDSHTYKEK